jgi:Flp pilus assembly protein TadG
MAGAVLPHAVRHTWQRIHRQQDQEAGYALVEFAFSLMVLLMLTFGMVDLGRAVYAANVVQAAAQMGARAGLVDIATAVPAVQSRLAGLDPTKAQITAALVSNERVEVEVTYEFEFITPYLSQLVSGGIINLSGSASMISY